MPVKKYDQNAVVAEISSRLKEASRAPNIKRYSPHSKQESFHRSKAKRKLYIGGNRSGKTTGGVAEGVWRSTGTHPYRPDLNSKVPVHGRVVGVDFNHGVEKILIPQYKQWIVPSTLRGGSWEAAYNKELKTLYFDNGSSIEFMSYDQDLDKFAGTARDWVHFDEEPPKAIHTECLARLIDRNGDYWVTMTPVEGMTWIYDDLYEKNVNNADGSVFVIEINTLENPYLSGEAVEEFVNSIDKEDITTRVGGKFVSIGGRIYKEFDPTTGGPNVLSEPFDEPAKSFKDWLWILALDHGLNNPTAVLWIAIDPNGFGVVFDEHYQNEWTIDQHAKAINAKIRSHGVMPELLVADPSIQNRSPTTMTSVQQEYQERGLSFMLGNNDVKSGLARVRRYLKPANYVGKHRNGELFPEGTDNFTRLRITPNCTKLIWELKRYRFKTYATKKLQFENNPYDEPQKKDDHACDALRYAIMTQPDLRADSRLSHGDRVDDIMKELGHKISNTTSEIADPLDRLNRSPLSEDSWEYDEHMGGLW